MSSCSCPKRNVLNKYQDVVSLFGHLYDCSALCLFWSLGNQLHLVF